MGWTFMLVPHPRFSACPRSEWMAKRVGAPRQSLGIIYGISGFGFARQLGIRQVGEVRDYINAYFDNFPGIRGYMDKIKMEAREAGHVETLLGRRIHIGGITASNPA